MANKKPLTPDERLYNQIRGKLKGFITRGEHKGFQFFTDALPKVPKSIKPESISKLQKLWENRENLYKKAIYGGSASNGFLVSGVKGAKLEREAKKERDRQRRQERKQQKQAPMPTAGFTVPDNVMQESSWFDKSVIGEYKRSLKYLPTLAYTLITEWVDRMVSEIGEHLVALMLEDGIRNGVILRHEDGYEEEKIRSYITEMENYFWMPTDRKAEITDALDSNENFNAY